MAPPDSGPSPTPEKRQFTIQSCLGRGGFGEVYRASMVNATGLENEVAVKLLHHDLDRDDQAAQRLRDEGRMLGALVHPSILRIYDFVVLDGRVGLVMEYVEGQDLSKCIRGPGRMPSRAVIAVIGRVADALRSAWESPSPNTGRPLHLIHRDIKPQNIRIGTQGDVKLLDFGVARSANVQREAQTNTGHMVGSYLYMAPECLLENQFGRESDVFALGATMYEALAHRRLFRDQSLRELYVLVLQEDRYREYLDGALADLDAPEPVVNLVRQMLARAPMDRPTATEVASICDDLVESMDGTSLRRWARSREWPPPNEVQGMLDGRVITEATMASQQIPGVDSRELGAPRRGLDLGMVVGTLGTLALLGGGLFAVVGVVFVLAGVMFGLSGPGTAPGAIQGPYRPAIPSLPDEDDESLRPERSERIVGSAVRVAPQPTPPEPTPTSPTVLNLDTDQELRLTQGDRTFRHLDRVPPGTYSVQIDWGGGYQTLRDVTVASGQQELTVTCNRFKRTCDVR
jgi:serine/threonine protein kinase